MENNLVENFLRKHPSVIFAPKTISRHTRVKLKCVVKIAHSNSQIRLAKPREVGSGCHQRMLMTIKHADTGTPSQYSTTNNLWCPRDVCIPSLESFASEGALQQHIEGCTATKHEE